MSGPGPPAHPLVTHCSSVKPVRLRQYMGKSWNWKV